MPKIIVPQNIAAINSIRYEIDKGEITSIKCDVEINYGKWGRNETIDLLPLLSESQKTNAVSFYMALKSLLTKEVLE